MSGERSAVPGEAIRLENLPQGDEYMVNTRGEILHLRSYTPEKPEDVRALVIFIPGYGGHVNSRPKVTLGKTMSSAGVAMVHLDLPGHGYSQGERAYINHYTHWADDISQLIEAVAGGGFTETSKGSTHLTPAHLERLSKVPFFFSGESLGGGLSLYMGLSLYENKHPLLPRFKGVALIAPAIRGNPPPAPVVTILRYCVAPIMPRTQIPDMLESVRNPLAVWKREEDRAMVARDDWGKPGAIGWGHNMKFRMGLNMMDMVATVCARLSQVQFPFLIMHDPQDAIVQFGPSTELMEKAITPKDDPRNRELKEMNGWLHDLLTNNTDEVIGNIKDWVLYHVNKAS